MKVKNLSPQIKGGIVGAVLMTLVLIFIFLSVNNCFSYNVENVCQDEIGMSDCVVDAYYFCADSIVTPDLPTKVILSSHFSKYNYLSLEILDLFLYIVAGFLFAFILTSLFNRPKKMNISKFAQISGVILILLGLIQISLEMFVFIDGIISILLGVLFLTIKIEKPKRIVGIFALILAIGNFYLLFFWFFIPLNSLLDYIPSLLEKIFWTIIALIELGIGIKLLKK